MKFEEQFPSLMEHALDELGASDDAIQDRLMEHCLDKQKVREVIGYVKTQGTFTNRNWDIILKQKLGLEE